MSRRRFLCGMAAVASSGLGGSSLSALLDACRSEPAVRPSATTRPATASRAGIRASGAHLFDATGHEVRLTGVNWFGLETPTFAPHGLWARNWNDMLDQIAASGFNTIRLPYSNQLLEPGSTPTSIDLTKNADLTGLSGLQLMDRIIEGAARRELMVVLDRHRPTADAQSELWYTDRVSESRWIDDWVMLASRYRSQRAVVGADLHNEPHGAATWGDDNQATDWRLAAERVGNAIHQANADWLIIVEGIERHAGASYWWGGNLRGARDAPVRLRREDKLVYSAHDYGPEVFPQRWFYASDFPANLPALWNDNWAWLATEDRAPVLVGEFGGRSVGADREGTWQRSLVGFLKRSGLSYTYWAWNPDSGDTGGILEDDWMTIDQHKLSLLTTYQWPKAGSVAARSLHADAA